jgi:phage terminase large subunit-like protein
VDSLVWGFTELMLQGKQKTKIRTSGVY